MNIAKIINVIAVKSTMKPVKSFSSKMESEQNSFSYSPHNNQYIFITTYRHCINICLPFLSFNEGFPSSLIP